MRFRINPWFLALLAFYFFTGLLYKALLVFLLVTGHELAHALVARLLGIRVREIELLPVGGVARLEGPLELKPFTDIIIAAAGPAFNFNLLILFFAGQKLGLPQGVDYDWPGLQYFWRINVLLLVFNLLPALPLDGGRIHRALLATKLGLKRATELTLYLSSGLALSLMLLGLVGLYLGITGLDFFLVAFFLLYTARKEKASTPYLIWRTLLERHRIEQNLMLAEGQVLVAGSQLTVLELVEKLRAGGYNLVCVIDEEDSCCYWIKEHELLDILLNGEGETRLKKIIKRC
ncbi:MULTISPECIES: M50 family metallopeptidase [unclassified Carboxydocella]|uniref:M50 family metallopeptidase n=1 Tax=unclassified Carboxydocella TaxID=2685367 RepID=UPI0009AE0F65|nr:MULTISPECIES: M50 family metallopeptidase [unclassified Carboxydocella]AVX31556.1 stage IV sporulation protein FB [Carboxydocella thermautotrophica]GAW27771.1 peptidase M50 [Carboxydocella sp. ULO1]GAW30315.1 peptidase M50 [Carboxydocella sp. JDF658]